MNEDLVLLIQLSIPALAALLTVIVTSWAQRKASSDEYKRELVRLEKERIWQIEDREREKMTPLEEKKERIKHENQQIFLSLYGMVQNPGKLVLH
ncbi:MAG: hypothetical protein GY797_41100 [Deltaproteobacteria bacterium]|nr:hypothetical protein [Deltaproteobacteria bacterium]